MVFKICSTAIFASATVSSVVASAGKDRNNGLVSSQNGHFIPRKTSKYGTVTDISDEEIKKSILNNLDKEDTRIKTTLHNRSHLRLDKKKAPVDIGILRGNDSEGARELQEEFDCSLCETRPLVSPEVDIRDLVFYCEANGREDSSYGGKCF